MPNQPPIATVADIQRLVRRVLVAAAVDGPLSHDGEECGPMSRCPDQRTDESYALLELLPSGDILAYCLHAHRGRHRPDDPDYAVLRKAFPS